MQAPGVFIFIFRKIGSGKIAFFHDGNLCTEADRFLTDLVRKGVQLLDCRT